MNHDPEIFGKDAEHFDPARYLDASGHVAPVISDLRKDGHFSYGFGIRICVGRHSADNSLFMNIATLLWAMKIERKKDASGRLVPLDVDSWVDVGLVVLAVFITYCYVDANTGFSADVRSRLRPRSHHASLRFLRCLDRNVSCEDYEDYVAYSIHGGKKLEFLHV